jgi:DNA-directed RNA polymerase specialized sigma24 family protein
MQRARSGCSLTPQPYFFITINKKIIRIKAKPKAGGSVTAFDKFLACLDPDRERADERYLQLHHSLIRILEWKGSRTPAEHVDEIIDRVCRKIDEGERIDDIFKYCHAVLNFVFLESLKKPGLNLEQEGDDEHSFSQIAAPELEEEDERMACLERCLSKLPAENRDLIVRYYEGDQRAKIENRKRLAAELEISAHNLEVRASRIREKLQDCVGDCLKMY